MSEEDVQDWSDYCRHWDDPEFCKETCARCQHRCGSHDDASCLECDCKGWQEAPSQKTGC